MSPVVETTAGKVQGSASGSVRSFLGIPYAEPPTGDLRFRAPRPARPWTGVRVAASPGSPAVQTVLNPANPPADPGDEDCLYLNVWTPNDDERHPVVMWVHGGAFVVGSGSDIDGAALAQAGFVVVAVNYRVGPFGYLYLDDIAPGLVDSNLALRDLLLALDWVRANVAAFGGDPEQIALVGESSGAMMIGAMLGAPACSGKVRGAWLMSGAARQVRSREVATRSADMFIEALGLAREHVGELPRMPVDALVSASNALAAYSQDDRQFDAEVMLPVVGDDVLPEHPMVSIRKGAAKEVNLVVSWTLKDMQLFRIFDSEKGGYNKELFARRLLGDAAWSRLVDTYRTTGDDWYVDLLTDFHFAVPARRLAEAQLQAGGTSRVARFDRAPATPPWDQYGPVHSCDLFYLWTPFTAPGNGALQIGAGSGMLPEDQPLATLVRDITRELASGLPQPTVPLWPVYNLTTRPTLLLDDPARVENDPAGARRAAWDGLLE